MESNNIKELSEKLISSAFPDLSGERCSNIRESGRIVELVDSQKYIGLNAGKISDDIIVTCLPSPETFPRLLSADNDIRIIISVNKSNFYRDFDYIGSTLTGDFTDSAGITAYKFSNQSPPNVLDLDGIKLTARKIFFEHSKNPDHSDKKTGFTMHHLHYPDWPDHDSCGLKNLIFLLKTIYVLHRKIGGTIVFHCLAGVGRSLTAATAYKIYRNYVDGNALLDLPEEVKNSRKIRKNGIEIPQSILLAGFYVWLSSGYVR